MMNLEEMYDEMIDLGYEVDTFTEFDRAYVSITFKKGDEKVRFYYGKDGQLKFRKSKIK